MLAIEVVDVQHDHGSKAAGHKTYGERAAQTRHKSMPKALLLVVAGKRLVLHAGHKIHSSQKILVTAGHRTQVGIGTQRLNVGLDYRSVIFHVLHEFMLALDGLVHYGLIARGTLSGRGSHG